jgi:hypothetical protein
MTTVRRVINASAHASISVLQLSSKVGASKTVSKIAGYGNGRQLLYKTFGSYSLHLKVIPPLSTLSVNCLKPHLVYFLLVKKMNHFAF